MPKKKLPKLSNSALGDLDKLSPAAAARATGSTSRYTGATSHVRRDSLFTKDLSLQARFRADSTLLAMKIKHEREMKELELETAKMQARAGGRSVGGQPGQASGVGNVTVVGGSPKGLLKAGSAVFGRQGYLVKGATAAAGLLVGGGKARIASQAAAKLAGARTVRALLKP